MAMAPVFINQSPTVPLATNALCVIQGTNVPNQYELTPTVVTLNPTTGAFSGGTFPAAGDVDGPASATLNAIAVYADTTGKVIKNSTVTVDGSGNVVAAGSVTAATGLAVSAGGAAIVGNSTVTGSLTASTTLTATLGNVTATNGNLACSTAGTGLLFNPGSASGAASGPVVLNARVGRVTFTAPSIAAGAVQTFTITNSAITGSGTIVSLSMVGATAGSALSIQSYIPTAGSLAIAVTNGTGATTTIADITFTFIVLN